MPRDLSPTAKQNAKAFIQELARERGWSGTELAHKLGISQPSASNLLKGPNFPSHATTSKAAKLAGLQLEPIFSGERIPSTSVRDSTAYEELRRDLESRFKPEVLDAATRALDALPVAGISPENFTDAALFAQRHMQVQPIRATGAALRGLEKVAQIQDSAAKKSRRSKGE